MKKKAMDDLNRPGLDEFRKSEKIPVIIVLDNVRSALNAGSVFRTADAFAVQEIFICGITAVPPNRELLKTALGAEQSVSWKYFATVEEALTELKNRNAKIIAIEQTENSTSLLDFNPAKKDLYAFIFGNEVNGISEACASFIDTYVEIPQFGTKHSFNISVTVGIVLWDYFSKNKN